MSIEDCVRHLVAHLVCQYSKSGKRNLSVLELRIWLCVAILQLKCCIVKITFPINFVNHGLMRKCAAQYLCLQIANLPLTVNILLLYNSLWVELHPKRLFFLLDKFSASVCHQELQVQQHPMWPRPLDASCQMTGKTWNHIGYEKLRSQQLNKI